MIGVLNPYPSLQSFHLEGLCMMRLDGAILPLLPVSGWHSEVCELLRVSLLFVCGTAVRQVPTVIQNSFCTPEVRYSDVDISPVSN